jgi:hypothetical protein
MMLTGRGCCFGEGVTMCNKEISANELTLLWLDVGLLHQSHDPVVCIDLTLSMYSFNIGTSRFTQPE